MDWAVNFATQRPDGSGLLAVVGDDPATLLLDSKTGNRTHTLEGHLDYSFAAAWHPSGTLLATGNQVRRSTALACWAVCAACRRMTLASLQHLQQHGSPAVSHLERWSCESFLLGLRRPQASRRCTVQHHLPFGIWDAMHC